jgi:monofunctional biosynthetic peptidoglycan transglycosylase
LRFADVPATSFQLQDVVGVSDSGNRPDTTHVQSMDIEDMSRAMIAVTVVNEDGDLGERDRGVNWEEQWERREDPTRFGSSIPQQYVKNLLLVRHQNPARKLLEAGWAELYAVLVPPPRQLELYLNSVEFGPGIWGICEASWRLAGKHPSELTVPEAAWLLQQLPDPKNRTYAVRDDAPITRSRIAELGGTTAVAQRFGITDLAEEQADPSCSAVSESPLRLTPSVVAFMAVLVGLVASLVALTVGVAAWTLGWDPGRRRRRRGRRQRRGPTVGTGRPAGPGPVATPEAHDQVRQSSVDR